MRNLKKVLALVLALVMAMSLVTIATAADFSDDADIDYSEAVDVMVAAGIIDGVGNNSFDPNGTLTREQAAKLITYMLLGENSEKLGVEGTSFNDVAATRWSAPAIEYCASLGIIAGAGDGNFYPAGKLTGYAFAKMLLTALGYDSEIEKFVGAGWTIPVATIGMEVGLHEGLENMFGNAEISRQEAAQMALNAIKAPLVEYPNKGSSVSVNGVVVDFTAKQYEYITTTIARTQTISKVQLSNSTDYTIEFGEKYLPKLELKEEIDVFGRPSYTWSYDRKEIGTYIDEELLIGEYTNKVTGEDLYNLITSATLKDKNTTVEVFIDGEMDKDILDGNTSKETFYFDAGKLVKGNDKAVGGTGKGVLTQVFEKTIVRNNTTYTEITIAIINTYLAKATSDYAAKQDKVSLKVYSVEDVTSGSDVDLVKNTKLASGVAFSAPLDASGDDFDVKDVKEDDIFLVTVADGAIQTMDEPEVIAGTEIDAFKKTSSVTVGGTKYEYASTAKYDEDVLDNYTGEGSTNLKDKTYNVYLDPYGYVIGVDEVEGANNYVFITGYDGNYSYLTNKTADMGAIFPDGTMKTIKVKTNSNDSSPALFAQTSEADPTKQDWNRYAAYGASGAATDTTPANGVPDVQEAYVPGIVNTWCTYTVNDAGEYSLTIVPGDGTTKANQSRQGVKGADKLTIDTKRVQLTGADGRYVFGNDATTFINTELEKISFPISGGNAKTGTIISDVESVTTGVRNVNLEVTDKTAQDPKGVAFGEHNATPIYEVYTLYKTNNRDIIAVVTLDAEDSGSNSVYAYVTSDNVTEESYSKADKEYTWSREVVIDGELTTVTYKGDTLKNIGTSAMTQGNWYELKLNADGHVRKVDSVSFGSATSNKYQDTVAGVVPAWNANTNVEIMQDRTTVTKLSFSEGTLWTDAAGTTGISVDSNVKVVICNADGLGNKFDTVADGYTGPSGVRAAIDDLNSNFAGDVSAVYGNSGRAVVLIFNCTSNDPNYNGGTVTPDPVPGKVTLYAKDGKLYVDSSITDTTEQAAAIRAWLEDNEYSDISVQIKGGEITAKGTKGGVEYTWSDGSDNTIDNSKTLITIKVDGKDTLVPSDATIADVTGVASHAKNFVMETSGSDKEALATTTPVAAGKNYGTTGYVEYQATAPTAPSAKWTVSDLDATTVTAKKGGTDTKFVAIGGTVSYKLTSAGAVTQAKGASAPSKQYSLTLAGAAFDTSGCTYAKWKYTKATGALETQLVAGDGVNDVTYIGATDTIIVTVTVPAAAEVTNSSLQLTEQALA